MNLERAFVRPGLIRERDFIRDFAIAQTLPGPAFVNLTALCGVRLGGVRIAAAGIALVLLPGAVAISAALAFLSTSDPWVTRLFHGVLVGAVGVLAASFARGASRFGGWSDAVIAGAVLVPIVLGAPMVVAVLAAGTLGVLRHRYARETLP